jgi:hypothetical protein
VKSFPLREKSRTSFPLLWSWILKPSNLISCSHSDRVGGAERSFGLAMGMNAIRGNGLR